MLFRMTALFLTLFMLVACNQAGVKDQWQSPVDNSSVRQAENGDLPIIAHVKEVSQGITSSEGVEQITLIDNQRSLHIMHNEVYDEMGITLFENPAFTIHAAPKEGYCFLVSAGHVVREADRIKIKGWGGSDGFPPEVLADFVGVSDEVDLAVVAIPYDEKCRPFPIDQSKDIYAQGTSVLGYGIKNINVNQETINVEHVSLGMLAGLWGRQTGGNLDYVLQLDASKGFSGGAVVSQEGKLVGMTLSILHPSTEDGVVNNLYTAQLALALSAANIQKKSMDLILSFLEHKVKTLEKRHSIQMP